MTTLNVNRIALIAHRALVGLFGVRNDLTKNPIGYRNTLRVLAQLSSNEVTLERLKKDASNLHYFNFRSNSDKFAEAVWEARQTLSKSTLKKKRATRKKKEVAGDTTDTSTSE